MEEMNSRQSNNLMGRDAVVTIRPAVVISKSWNTFKISVTLGRGGLAKNDSIGLVCGSNIDRWQFQFASHIWGCYVPWQVNDPAAPNFVTAECSSGAALEVSVGGFGGLKTYQNRSNHLVHSLRDRGRYVLEIKSSKTLRKGDLITLTWGDTRWGSPGVMAPALGLPYYFFPFKFSLLPRLDRDLPARQGDYDALPRVLVKGKKAAKLHLAAQPLVGSNEPFDVHCAAVDEYGNCDESFKGNVQLRLSGQKGKGPKRIKFAAADKGCIRIKGIRFKTRGWHRITAVARGVKSRPHPVLVGPGKPADRIYFGEMHAHTLDCDGTFPAWFHFNYARYVAGLDFAALGSHAEYFGGALAWQRYLKAASDANVPGKFITFYGYEWAGEGHTNAYFFREKDAVNIYGKRILQGKHPSDRPPFRIPCNRERDFIRKIKSLNCPALCITHFHSDYIDPVDDEVVRLHEVYSTHQQIPRDKKLQGILGRKLMIGVVAGSDSHRLPLGSLCPDPDSLWRQPLTLEGKKCSQSMQKKAGIQAVFAPRLGRRELWDGMLQRHTYGTTGARMLLLFSINGVAMGGKVILRKGERPVVSAKIGCQAEINEVVLFKFDGRVWSIARRLTNTGKLTLDFKYRDRWPVNNVLYYMRVRQDDNEYGWTSPIWVKVEGINN